MIVRYSSISGYNVYRILIQISILLVLLTMCCNAAKAPPTKPAGKAASKQGPKKTTKVKIYKTKSTLNTTPWWMAPTTLTTRAAINKTEGLGILIKELNHPPKNPTGFRSFPDMVWKVRMSIDKTLLIKDIIEDVGKIFIVSIPRLWGKTMTVDMLYVFFNIPLDRFNKMILPPSTARWYDIFAKGQMTWHGQTRTFVQPVRLNKYKDFVDQHFGQYPVIVTYLLHVIAEKNYRSWTEYINQAVSESWRRHAYLVGKYFPIYDNKGNNETVRNEAYKHIRIFKNYIVDRQKYLSTEDLENSLYLLSKYLFEYYNKKVIILIDNYMFPCEELFYQKNFPEEDKGRFVKFYLRFMKKTFVNNKYIQKAVLFGRHAPFEELHHVALSDAVECNFLTGTFMEHFGVNHIEMQNYYNIFNISNNVRQMVDLYHDGYKVNKRDLRVYNIWPYKPIVKIIPPSCNWVVAGSARLFVRNFLRIEKFKNKFIQLLNDSSIEIELENRYLTLNEFEIIAKASKRRIPEVNETLCDKAYLYLYYEGYLTLAEDANIYADVKRLRLKLPNKEVSLRMQRYGDELLYPGFEL